MRRIFIAVNGGVLSEVIAQKGVELAAALHGEIALVTIVEPSMVTGEGGYSGLDLINTSREAGQAMLEHLMRVLGVKDAWIFAEVGSPAAMLIKLAGEWKADMIVMGTHGRKGVSHLLMGSVAEQVLRHAQVPVVVIPADAR
ncbi:MAG: universal stress protein [Puia sp.]|nr:universal stress protein [Puia sp.]